MKRTLLFSRTTLFLFVILWNCLRDTDGRIVTKGIGGE